MAEQANLIMGFEIPETEPSIIYPGATLTFYKDLPDYPPPTWALNYYLLNSTNKITIAAGVSGSRFLVDVDESMTSTWIAGLYQWFSRVTDGTDVRSVDHGIVEIKADVATSTTLETRSLNRQLLDAIRSVLAGRITKEIAAYSIGGRSITRMSLEELLAAEDKLLARVDAEERAEDARNGKQHSKIRVRFSKG